MSEQTSHDNHETYQEQSARGSAGEAWEAVGQSFKALGESLAEAFRSTVENEENRVRIERMQDGVESMIKEVEQAIKDSTSSAEVQKFHDEAVKTMHTLRDTGEETVQEIRPAILSALQRASDGIQRVIDDLQEKEKEAEGKADDDTEPVQ